MHFRHSRLATAAGLLAAALIGTATPADAQTAASGDSFATQARTAGLSASQAQTLQKRIDTRLAEFGGVQTAANEIKLPSGIELLLPLPGEARARDLDAPKQTTNAQAPASCAYYTFCAYEGTNFTGEVLRQVDCDDFFSIPWTSDGSWSNNQSSGTRARMYDEIDFLIYTTPGAYSEDRVGDWEPVWWVDACN
ncbi:hypothetical protein [Streptomyces milbemycinicus]|uniref:hypothetical protein n=1 Tax=Streptomyces milbemycinicus TaxID=476552 RepID=UPI003404795D